MTDRINYPIGFTFTHKTTGEYITILQYSNDHPTGESHVYYCSNGITYNQVEIEEHVNQSNMRKMTLLVNGEVLANIDESTSLEIDYHKYRYLVQLESISDDGKLSFKGEMADLDIDQFEFQKEEWSGLIKAGDWFELVVQGSDAKLTRITPPSPH